MKTIKKSIFTLALIVSAGAALTSCKKTVTGKKLDGSWNVTSGTMTNSNSYTSGGQTTTYSSTSTFDGATLSTSQTQGSVTTTVTQSQTIDYTFDKKTGEYTSTMVENAPEYNTYIYIKVYDDASGSYDLMNPKYVDQNTARQSTTTTSGFFTTTGGAGDEIEDNSQVTFQQRKMEVKYDDTYSYVYTGTTTAASLAGKYMEDYSTGLYLPFPTSETGTETNTGESSEAIVWNVTELKKGEMSVEYVDESTNTNSGDNSSSSYKSEVSWKLTQE